MANWAIVIGVDKYWRAEACLKGSVNDALRVREWLLDDNGGRVPSQNLILLLSPHLTQAPADVRWTEAKRDNIVDAIEMLLQKSGGQGDRFFLHFSGHGLTARVNFSNQSGIVPADFKDTLTDKTVTLGSLFELFQATQFKEQFFFVDACRNIPFDTEKRLGDYPNPRAPVPPVSPQFIMYATQPGVKAVEVHEPGNERGAFTGALLAGLRGSGAAKRWDEQAGEYVVRWNSLFEFIERDVKSRKLAAAATPNGPLIQQPRQFGERGTDNPELARFAADAFGPEALAVDLRPSSITSIAEIVVAEMAGPVDRKAPPLPSLPCKFQLVPRTYSVRAAAPGYVSKRRFTQVDLYQAEQVEVELDPAPPQVGTGKGLGSSSAPSSPGTEPAAATRGFGASRSKAWLIVRSEDSLAELEITDGSGRILAKNRSTVGAKLDPGFYRARLISPEGDAVEELIELLPGDQLPHSREDVTLRAAPPQSALLAELVARAGFPIQSDNTISTSETVGPSASLKLSTVLALATGAAMEVDSPHGLRLKALGLPSFQQLAANCANGVQVVLGDESSGSAWGAAELRCWRLDEHPPTAFQRPLPDPRRDAIASAALCRDPGTYWLSLRLAAGVDVTMPIAVLPNRATLVVVTRDVQGKTELHQYAPVLPGQPVEYRFLDPVLPGSRFAAMRRIELMQRSVANGRITPTLPDVDFLLQGKWLDPIAGCLGGYLLVRMGRPADLQVPAGNLTKFFTELSDAHVLNGVYLEHSGAGSDSKGAYLAALDRGLPIFRDGLALLDAAIQRHDLRGDRTEQVRMMLQRVPAGSLWSSFSDVLVAAPPSAPPPRVAGAL